MRLLRLFIPVLIFASVVHAQTSLKITRGWGGKDRAGRWNPILVRASDPVPRNVTLQLISPQPGGFESVLEEHLAIGPTPATFELLSPSRSSAWQQMIAVLRDSATGKFLAQFPPNVPRSSPDVAAVGPHAIFVGMSGTAAALEQLNNDLNADFAYLPAHQLPRSPLGYDCLEILLLNRSRLAEIDLDQQRAILDWVRSGGSLLITPGDDTPISASPLAAAQPCAIGEVHLLEFSNQSLSDLHLSQRFAHIAIRTLEPIKDAEPVQVLARPSIVGYSRRLGLGQVVVLPFDISVLQVDEPADRPAVVAMWRPIMSRLVSPAKPVTDTPRFAAPYNGFMSESPDQFREGAATATAFDFLAPSPSAPPRRWPGVVLLMLGIFAVIGPLDAFVLKLAGQSPWTWTTSVGWIATIVLAVLFGTSRLAPGKAVSLRALRLIDQVDDAIVATSDLVVVESTKSQKVQLKGAADDSMAGWWEPAFPGVIDAQGFSATQSDLSFHQSDVFCIPSPIRTDSGLPRFLRRQAIHSASPVIHADLKLTGEAGTARISGTIQNLTIVALKDLRLRTRLGVVSIPLDPAGTLGPGQIIKLDQPASGEPFLPGRFEGRYQDFGSFGKRADPSPVSEKDLWAVIPDLAARRSLRIDGLFEANMPVACIYAQSVNPAPVAELDDASQRPAQTHQWLRVLIPLAHEPI